MSDETSPRFPGWLLLSLMTVSILYGLDTTIATVVLPQMQGSLQASREQLSWVLTAYIVVSAIVTPLLSMLSERFSIARVLEVSVVVFTLSSVLCGLAKSLDEMVLYRMIQGASGAALLPLVQSALLTHYPKAQHARLLATWTMGVMLGPVMGPVIGGYLADQYNWRWVFFVNLPIGTAAFFGVVLTLPRDRPSTRKPFDLLGYLLVALGIGGLQLCLDRGNVEDWFESPEIITEALIAAICLYMFVVHSRTTRNPFFTPALFRDRNFVVGTALTTAWMICVFTVLTLLPLFLQQLQGYPVLQAGLILSPRAVGMTVATITLGRLSHLLQPRYCVITGMALTAVAIHMMTGFNLEVPASTVITSGVLHGVGAAMVMVPLTTVSFSTLGRDLQTEGAVFVAVLRNIGSSIGISVALTVLARSAQRNQAQLVEDLTLFDTGKWELLHNLFGPHAESVAAGEIARQASMMAYLEDFNILLYFTLALMPFVFLMRVIPAKAQI